MSTTPPPFLFTTYSGENRAIALYADEKVEYGKVVGVLDMAARARLRMVLATRASEAPAAGDANMRR